MGSGVLKVTVLGSSLPALNFMLASAQGQMSDIALGGTLTQLSFCFHVLLCVFSFKKINHMTRVCCNPFTCSILHWEIYDFHDNSMFMLKVNGLSLAFQIEISQQLLDGLACYLVQTFTVPRGNNKQT